MEQGLHNYAAMKESPLSNVSNIIIHQTIILTAAAAIFTLTFSPRISVAQNIETNSRINTTTTSPQKILSNSGVRKPVTSQKWVQTCERELDCGQYATCVINEGQGLCVELYPISQQIRLENNRRFAADSNKTESKVTSGQRIAVGLLLVTGILTVGTVGFLSLLEDLDIAL